MLSMIVMPIALGHMVSSAIIGGNEVRLEETMSGGMELPPDIPIEIKPGNDSSYFGDHPGFWIHDPSAGREMLLGNRKGQTFEVTIPAHSKFIIMVERPPVLYFDTNLEFKMKLEGDEEWRYYADNNDSKNKQYRGKAYYSAASEDYMQGNRLMPYGSIGSLEFMSYDRDVIIEVDAYRQEYRLRLAILFE